MLVETSSLNRSKQLESEEFVLDDSNQSTPQQELVRLTLTGSRQGIERMIQLLHNSKVIAGGEWSNAVSIKNSAEVISVAIRMV
ncbi:MAG: hypothetical protein ACFBSC_17450 [Microcoleaceae cyanobacterium]